MSTLEGARMKKLRSKHLEQAEEAAQKLEKVDEKAKEKKLKEKKN